MRKKVLVSLLIVSLIAGCSANDSASEEDFDETSNIHIYSRDSSSGTRIAFEEIVEITAMSDNYVEAANNGDLAKKVGADKDAIGYVSLITDLEANNICALKYEGVEATIENVVSGEYQLYRPFNYVTRATGDFDSEEKEALIMAFLDFLENSIEGRQAIYYAGGVVDTKTAQPWSLLKEKHPIVAEDNSKITLVIGGSTSVEKTIKSALEAFQPLAGNVKFKIDQTGSSDGYKRTLGSDKDGANTSDIGFASRNFDASEEVKKAAKTGEYARDAIIIVVSKKNNLVTDLTKKQIQAIFEGITTTWADAKK